MLDRILEPEVMDTAAEAIGYNSMDHRQVNRDFVDDFLAAVGKSDLAVRLSDDKHPAKILDTGTGTALIPIELCARPLCCVVTAIDLSGEMLKVAKQNISSAGFRKRIPLQLVDSKALPCEDDSFHSVISNSIVHHIPQPKAVLREMLRVLEPGGLLFVRDLLRPNDSTTLDFLVTTYAGDATAHQQQMFRESLHAALNLDEIRAILEELERPTAWVTQTTDRHWTITGIK